MQQSIKLNTPATDVATAMMVWLTLSQKRGTFVNKLPRALANVRFEDATARRGDPLRAAGLGRP